MPDAHPRGSQGWRFEVEAEGVAIAPEAVVVGAADAAVVVGAAAGAVVLVGTAGGGLTANCEPVTTVTCAPSTTSAGS